MRILIIEDDPEGLAVIQQGLEECGHETVAAQDYDGGLARARLGGYDVMVVDRMLPGGDGLEIVRSLRAEHNVTPAVFLTARSDVDDCIAGLRAGGDDYVSKPYSFGELLARLEAVVRRQAQAGTSTVLAVGDLEVDVVERTVHRGGVPILLQPREFRLLEFLMRRAGQTVTRAMLLEGVWKYHFDPETKVIDVQMSRLRQKIEKDFSKPLIHTVRGAGYCIRADD
jgi:two-component system OmpR family response regulator